MIGTSERDGLTSGTGTSSSEGSVLEFECAGSGVRGGGGFLPFLCLGVDASDSSDDRNWSNASWIDLLLGFGLDFLDSNASQRRRNCSARLFASSSSLDFFSRSLRSCSDAEAGTEKFASEKFETDEGAISEAASGTALAADEFEELGELLSSSLLSSSSYGT